MLEPAPMSEIPSVQLTAQTLENVLVKGDLSRLSETDRMSFYNELCKSLNLNPLSRPFEYITLNGKLTLYAKKDATDQIRAKHSISIKITSREKIDDVYIVTAQASTPDGRTDESTGVVALGKASGDNLANLFMKAETKAKRRVTLSLFGLGILDETEVETIRSDNARVVENKKLVESPRPQARPVVAAQWHPSEAQAKRLFAIAKSKGWDANNYAPMRELISSFCGKDSTADLDRSEYDGICEHMLSNQYKAPMSEPDLSDPTADEINQNDTFAPNERGNG